MDGQIYNEKIDKIMKTKIDRGYERIGLRKNKKCYFKQIHRLLAETFLENPKQLSNYRSY